METRLNVLVGSETKLRWGATFEGDSGLSRLADDMAAPPHPNGGTELIGNIVTGRVKWKVASIEGLAVTHK